MKARKRKNAPARRRKRILTWAKRKPGLHEAVSVFVQLQEQLLHAALAKENGIYVWDGPATVTVQVPGKIDKVTVKGRIVVESAQAS